MTVKPHDGSKEPLAIVLRGLIDHRGFRQKAVAKRVGITESSLSHILNGHARPRQLTLTRLMQQLAVSRDEEQQIVAAYDHAEFGGLPERPSAPEHPMPEDEIERVRRYMAVKSMSVAFEEDVARILRDGGIRFERPYRKESVICDFYLPGPPTVAIDCRFNVSRDWDRTLATVKLLREELPCDLVLVAIPDSNDLPKFKKESLQGARLVTPETVLKEIQTMQMKPTKT